MMTGDVFRVSYTYPDPKHEGSNVETFRELVAHDAELAIHRVRELGRREGHEPIRVIGAELLLSGVVLG